MRYATLAIALFTALAACSDDGEPDPPMVDATVPDGAANDLDAPATVDASPPPACADATAALAAELYAALGACSVVVRLDYQTLEGLGFQMMCGSYASVDESEARATAQADTGYGQAGVMLNPKNPEDAFVFYESPGDFGGASVVSTDTGLTVFGGSIVWDGAGDITFPSGWRPPEQLGFGCAPSGGIPTSRGYDLISGSALESAAVAAAVDVVAQTALPEAMWSGGYVFDAVVLAYPRSVGVFDPNTAEWIVIVNSGWLE